MQDLIENLKIYLLEVLGFKIDPKILKSNDNLPIFLKHQYVIYSIVVLDKSYILAIAKYPDEATPSQISKHMELIEKNTKKSCIFATEKLPAYNRARLIAHRIRFIIPKVQMYLPDLGIDCRQTTSKPNSVSQVLTASAQTVVIYALIHGANEHFIPSKLAEKLKYTRMTMTRAFNELEALGLGKTLRKGKERCFYFQKRGEILWKQALPLMQNPIKKVLWIQVTKSVFEKIKALGFIAGISALSLQSNLNSSSYPIFALFKDGWKTLIKSEEINILPISEGANMQLEVWNYDPDLFDENHIVDPFSLFLSLRGIEDERVEKALMDIMEKIKW
ncbi:MAG: hypothetical protein KR126chlam5_01114 [Candidatus Anoxychlamydiales bacterium]|nr:hypothetical protein [Candidatus Anoxychlamydiales bacterium]